jgi:hypothetical protein
MEDCNCTAASVIQSVSSTSHYPAAMKMIRWAMHIEELKMEMGGEEAEAKI